MSEPEPPPIMAPPPPAQVPPPVVAQPHEPTQEEIDAAIEAMPEVGYPTWVKIVALATIVLAIISIARTPKALHASIAEARGKRYMESGQYVKAVDSFREAANDYPNSTRAILSLSEAYLAADQAILAATTLDQLVGRTLGESDYQHAAELQAQIEAKLPKEEDKSK